MSILKNALVGLTASVALLSSAAHADTRVAQSAPRAAVAAKAATAPKVARRAQGVTGFSSLGETETAGVAGLAGLGLGLGTCFAAGCGKSDSPGH